MHERQGAGGRSPTSRAKKIRFRVRALHFRGGTRGSMLGSPPSREIADRERRLQHLHFPLSDLIFDLPLPHFLFVGCGCQDPQGLRPCGSLHLRFSIFIFDFPSSICSRATRDVRRLIRALPDGQGVAGGSGGSGGAGGEGASGGTGDAGGAGARRHKSVGMFGDTIGRGRQVTDFARGKFSFSRSRATFSRSDAREHVGISPITRNRG